jgi:lipopolysaccharide assembly protein A
MTVLRYLKYLFLIVVALALVLMAMANREIVTLEVIPPDLAAWFGIQYGIELPLFLVILGGVVVGVLVGFVWEWLREHRHRAEAKTQKRNAQALEREVNTLKGPARDSQDEILAIVDGPRAGR